MGMESRTDQPLRTLEVMEPDQLDAGKPVGRRVFLGMLGLGGAGIVWGSSVAGAFGRLIAPLVDADRTGLTSLIPASGRFRIYSVVNFLPRRERADYRLKVTGLVDRPLDLTMDDLEAMPVTGMTKDFQCVTGWRVRDVPWKGVLLSHLLNEAGVAAGGTAVEFHSFDGQYTESLTLKQARRPDVLVAYEMLGKPVTRAHGGPVRLYVAPMYGYKSCKWLDTIEVTPEVRPGYWERRGYDTDAWIGRSNGRDDPPVT